MKMTVLTIALAMLIQGCASSSGSATSNGSISSASSRPSKTALHIEEGPLGFAVRLAAEQMGGGFVLMNGVEARMVGPFDFAKSDRKEVIASIIEAGRCGVVRGEHYDFIYPLGDPAYESLSSFSVEDAIDPRLASKKARLRFGAGIPLYNAFALLGHSLDVTLVADNAIADTLSGEVILDEAPLGAVIEALFKSARIDRNNIEFEGDGSTMFVRSVDNASKSNLLLNAADLDAEAVSALERKVDLSLPGPPTESSRFAAQDGATTLGKLLPTIIEQLGVPVTADRGVERLPVNPVVMRDVSLGTSIDLLMRQWPVARFGWTWKNGAIHLSYTGA